MLTEKDSRIRIHPSTISAWERGITQQPTAKTVSWIAKAFNDYTPFTLTGHMLLYDDLEEKFNQVLEKTTSESAKLNLLEQQMRQMDSLLKHCVYRIQALEQEAESVRERLSGRQTKHSLPKDSFLEIIQSLGITFSGNRFYAHDGTDVTDQVNKLRST